MKGGYQIFDLKGANFEAAGNSVTVTGAYKLLESSYKKAVLVENFSIADVEQTAFFATAQASGTDILLTSTLYNAQVSDDDTVTISEAGTSTAAVKAATKKKLI